MAGITLIQKLQKLFGARAVSDMMGRTTNVQTLAQGTNNPFARQFSKKYLAKNPNGAEEAAQSILENMQFAFGNKNIEQMKNFEANVDTLYNLKFPPKPGEAKVVDIGTKKQVTGEGLESLKDDLGLPEDIPPTSPLGESITKAKKADLLSTLQAKSYSANIEAFRRPIIRQMLLKDKRINLPEEVRKSLETKMDLGKNADPDMDPLKLLNKYYDVDFKKLDELEEIRRTTENQFEAADLFLKKGGLKPKKIKTVEDFADEGDLDPGGMAQGGRADFNVGGIAKLLNFLQGKLGKKAITTADKIARPESALTREMFENFNKRIDKKTETLKGDEVLTKPEVLFENKIKNQLETTYDDISGGTGFTGHDYKYDAQVLADGIAEDLGLEFQNLTIKQQTQLYSAALSRINKDLRMKRALKKASKPTETLKSIEETGGIDISNPEVADEFTRFMKETDPKGFKELEQKIQIDTFKPPKNRKPNAQGGIAGQLHLNQGGRVGLQKGGPPNKGRRNFLKLMAGLASLPVVGKLFKFAKPASKITQLKNTSTSMPEWFPKFVDKFINRSIGKKIDADITEFTNPDLPNLKITRHDDGRTFVDGNNEYNEGWAIDYKPPGYEVVDETTGKAVKIQGDFEAVEGRHVSLSPEDYDVDPFYVEDLDELTTIDVAEMEKYATGKITKTVKDAFGEDTGVKKGVHSYDMAVGKAENQADVLRDADLLDEDFASGGRVGLLLGGGVLKAMLKNLAKERGVTPSYLLKVMNYKALPSKIRNLMTKEQFLELKNARLKQVKNFRDMMQSRLGFNKSIQQGKAIDDKGTGMSKIFDLLEEDFGKKIAVPKNITEKDILEMEQMIKNMEMKGRKPNAAGGLAGQLKL